MELRLWGASLGLNAGIGMGLYLVYGESSSSFVATFSSVDGIKKQIEMFQF
jgi:hypothetical protein